MANHGPVALPAPTTSVTVPLSAEAEERLRHRAAARGIPVEEFARTVLERELSDPAADQWVAEWRALTARSATRTLSMDDSRESIYEGCGE